MIEIKEDYKKQLTEAAQKINSEFTIDFYMDEVIKTNPIHATGDITLKDKEFSYNYGFILGEYGIMFHDKLMIFGGRKKYFNYYLHNRIIDFNEQLAKNMGLPKILVKERSENLKGLYLSKGYNINKTLNYLLEKTLQ